LKRVIVTQHIDTKKVAHECSWSQKEMWLTSPRLEHVLKALAKNAKRQVSKLFQALLPLEKIDRS